MASESTPPYPIESVFFTEEEEGKTLSNEKRVYIKGLCSKDRRKDSEKIGTLKNELKVKLKEYDRILNKIIKTKQTLAKDQENIKTKTGNSLLAWQRIIKSSITNIETSFNQLKGLERDLDTLVLQIETELALKP
jgi:hypothetical protein